MHTPRAWRVVDVVGITVASESIARIKDLVLAGAAVVTRAIGTACIVVAVAIIVARAIIVAVALITAGIFITAARTFI